MNSTQRTHASLLVCLCFLGAAAGSSMITFARREALPQAPPAALPQPDWAPALAQILQELRALRETSSGMQDARVAVVPADAATESAAQRLERAIAALEARAASRPEEASVSSALRVAAPRSCAELLPEALQGFPEDFDWSARREALTKEHLLWTLPEVIAHYGKPDDVQASNTYLTLRYRVAVVDGTRYSVSFLLCSGYVTNVNLDS